MGISYELAEDTEIKKFQSLQQTINKNNKRDT